MNTIRSSIYLVAGIFLCSTGGAAESRRWPAGADEHATTITIPEGFSPIRWKAPAINAAGKKAPLVLAGRFRSADGKAEFAVAMYYVRHAPSNPEARRIAVPLVPGEKISDRKSNRKKVAARDGDREYWVYEEETTVAGSGYTRYILNSFSTSSLPGATSDFWEFHVADESARARFAAAWRQFKESLEVGED